MCSTTLRRIAKRTCTDPVYLCITQFMQWCMPERGKARALRVTYNKGTAGNHWAKSWHYYLFQDAPNPSNSAIGDSQSLQLFLRKYAFWEKCGTDGAEMELHMSCLATATSLCFCCFCQKWRSMWTFYWSWRRAWRKSVLASWRSWMTLQGPNGGGLWKSWQRLDSCCCAFHLTV